jgi:hypothetical protein
VYYPDQAEAIIAPFSSPASDQPSKSMLGPAFMESFKQFPHGTKYIYGAVNPGDTNSSTVNSGTDKWLH